MWNAPHTSSARSHNSCIIQRIKVHRHMLQLGGDLGIENWRPRRIEMRKINSRVKSNLDSIELKFSGAAQSAGSRLCCTCECVMRVCVFSSGRPHTTTNPLGAHPSMAFYFNNHIYCCVQFALATSISGLVPQGLSESHFNPVLRLQLSWLIQWKIVSLINSRAKHSLSEWGLDNDNNL